MVITEVDIIVSSEAIDSLKRAKGDILLDLVPLQDAIT